MGKRVRVLLVRHGETLWNRISKYQGQKDISLSELGFQQAEKIGLRLAKEKIDAVYSSDLNRAYETARAIAKHHNLDVQQLKELRETNFGCWEGLTYSEILETFADDMAKWNKDPWQTKIPGGECLEEVVSRTNKAFWNLACKHQGDTIVLVAHGDANRTLIAGLLEMDFVGYWKIEQDNVCLNIIEVDEMNRPTICLLNDTSHLNN